MFPIDEWATICNLLQVSGLLCCKAIVVEKRIRGQIFGEVLQFEFWLNVESPTICIAFQSLANYAMVHRKRCMCRHSLIPVNLHNRYVLK